MKAGTRAAGLCSGRVRLRRLAPGRIPSLQKDKAAIDAAVGLVRVLAASRAIERSPPGA